MYGCMYVLLVNGKISCVVKHRGRYFHLERGGNTYNYGTDFESTLITDECVFKLTLGTN